MGQIGDAVQATEERGGIRPIEDLGEDPDMDLDVRSQIDAVDAEEEEGGQVKVRRAPKGPTKKEREEHEATHIPYRDWCSHCVRGRAPNRPHRRADAAQAKDEESRRVPRISMDYFFMAQEGERASEYPMIVMVDEGTGNKYMRAVAKKGLGEGKEMEWLIKDMDEELKSWGHSGGEESELILKSDGEPSVKAVRDALGRYHGGRVTPEQPPPGESQANGRVEEAGKTIRGMVKVFKDVIEHNIGEKLSTEAIILQWLVRWSAMLISRFKIGSDGKTSYERQRGRRCQIEVVPFGEMVHYRRLSDKEPKNKLESRWEQGVWLGHARGSNEALIGTKDGVVRAWAIKRMPDGEKWNAQAIKDIQGTPAKPNPQMLGFDVPVHIHLPSEEGLPGVEEPPPARNESQYRRTYLKNRDFKEHGYTDGCEGCKRLRAGGMGARPHTEECRARMESILKDKKAPRWERAQERATERVWEEVKKLDPEAAKTEAKAGGDAASAAAEEGTAASSSSANQRGEAAAEASGGGAAASSSGVNPVREGDIRGTEGKADERAGQKRAQGGDDEAEQEEPLGKKVKETGGVGQKRRSDEAALGGEEEEPQATRRKELDPMDTEVIHALREAAKICAVTWSESRSKPAEGAQLQAEVEKYGLRVGDVMDLTVGWDFTKAEDRARIRDCLNRHRPRVIIGSPMCAITSPLQRLTPWSQKRQNRWMERKKHIEFMVNIYEEQLDSGGYFLHEHPSGTPTWAIEGIQRISGKIGVHTVEGDQCVFGSTRRGVRQRLVERVKKSTTFVTNSYELARELGRKCDGSHRHTALTRTSQDCSEGRYPEGLCRAICRGIRRELMCKVDSLRAVAEVEIRGHSRGNPDPQEFHEVVNAEIRHLSENSAGGAWDDVTGMPLDWGKVRGAREEELAYVRGKSVWSKVPRAEAVRQGAKVIQTRWIDINKGDDDNPVYRSRFVAKEFNDGTTGGLFAGTPPLEALRYLVHRAATVGKSRRVIMINDIARAFFEAKAKRTVFIELPNEDKTEKDWEQDRVGRLNMSLYGTRDAAKNWQEEVARMMRKWGFVQGVYNPCLYYHPIWDVVTLVHGDDFVSTGSVDGTTAFRKALEQRFKTKTQLIGSGGGEEHTEARVLNRVVRVVQDGWEYEPDQRHVDLLTQGLGLAAAKGVATPGEEEKKWEEEENAIELGPEDAKKFRGHAARLNYLAADRPDIAFSAKEVCRGMATPSRGDWKKLKRVARYLIDVPRTLLRYAWQGEEVDVETYTDSDWAGCKRTGKSTSGGAVTIGEHFIKGWATSQASVTLSSGEAELVAMTKATAETIGVLHMIQDLGRKMKGVVYADSSAALAIADRRGSGKLRHINIRMLWLQEREQRGDVELRKIKGVVNPADLMTKYMTGPRMIDLMRRIGQVRQSGRASTALEVQGAAAKATPTTAALPLRVAPAPPKGVEQGRLSNCESEGARAGVFGAVTPRRSVRRSAPPAAV